MSLLYGQLKYVLCASQHPNNIKTIETQQARQALKDIEARHRDIINLEKSIQVQIFFTTKLVTIGMMI